MISDKKNLALALSGGGVKAGAFHMGVCLALAEKGFSFAGGTKEEVEKKYPQDSMTFKTYVGSSAGSFIAALLASGYSPGDIIQAFSKTVLDDAAISSAPSLSGKKSLPPLNYRNILKFKPWSRWSWDSIIKPRKNPVLAQGILGFFKRNLRFGGVFSTDNIEKYLRTTLAVNDFSELGVNLFIIATYLDSPGKAIFGAKHLPKDPHRKIKYADYATISKSVACSTCLPPFFAPYYLTSPRGRKIYFFDGEIRDTISTHVAAEQNADLVIASYSMEPYTYNEEIGSLINFGVPYILTQAICQMTQQKIESHTNYRNSIKKLINAVNGYLKEIDLPKEQIDKLMDILISRTNYTDTEYIYIHPSPKDHELFFADFLTLNESVLKRITEAGFRAAIKTLKNH